MIGPKQNPWHRSQPLYVPHVKFNFQTGALTSIHSVYVLSGHCKHTCKQCPAGRVFHYRVGSGRVLDKIPGIGSGSGRVGVSKYANGYFRVSLLVSGIFRYFGYFGYFRVFLGIFWVFRVCWVIPETSGLPDISGNTRYSGFTRNFG